MPHRAVIVYNSTGTGGIVIAETRFPWGVYVPPTSGGSGGGAGGGGGGGGGTVTTPTPGPWYDCNWQARKRITIDHTKVPSTQSNFPVLISLTSDSGLWGRAQADGDDILFTAADGTTKLSHEIEYYSAGTLVAWVKVPSVSSVTDTIIYMYYGNSAAPNGQDKNGVWDANYMGVWHLKESGSGVTGEFKDSTSNANHGTGDGSGASPTLTQSGVADGAQTFDGNNDRIDTGTASTVDNIFAGGGTVEAWIYPTGWGESSYGRIYDKGHTNGWSFLVNNAEDPKQGLLFLHGSSGGSPKWCYWVTPASSIALSQWQLVAATFNKGSISNNPTIYINDAGAATLTKSGTGCGGNFLSDAAEDLDIGNNPAEDRTFAGTIDEVRISNIVRSADWIKTEYRNVISPSTFYSVATEEPSPCTPPTTVPITPVPTLTPNPAWYPYCGWAYRKNISINSTFRVQGSVSNFPVLISLSSDTDLSAHAKSDGSDIFFTQGDGQSTIPYEREYYSGGTLRAWVNVTSLTSTANTTIYMYYGFLSSPEMSHQNETWNSNYKGVWHLEESGSGVAGEFKDSTSNMNNGRGGSGASGSTPTMTTSGKIGNGEDYDGGDWINVPSASSLRPTTAITLSGWIRLRTFGSGSDTDTILRKGEDNPNNYLLRVDNRYATLEFNSCDGGDGYYIGTTYLQPNTWYYVAGTWQSGSLRTVYINGVPGGTGSYAGPIPTDTRDLYMGGRTGGDDLINGILDELRISNVARSADWIKTEYNNQNSPSTFYTVGKEESISCDTGPYYVQSRSQHFGAVSSASITLPGSSATGDLLVVSFVYDKPSLSVSGVSDTNGNSYVASRTTTLGTWGTANTYRAINNAGGAGPITATVSLSGAPNTLLDFFFLEYAGTDQTNPVDSGALTDNTDQASTTMNTSMKTLTKSPSLIYGFGAGSASGSSCTLNSPYTLRESANGQCAGDQTVAYKGPFNVTGTLSPSGPWLLQMVPFKGA
jgi:hypothetical protein